MANTQQYDLNQKIKEEVKRLVEGRTINECILQTKDVSIGCSSTIAMKH